MPLQAKPVSPSVRLGSLQYSELHPHHGDWLKDLVLGLNDGLVTTLVFGLGVSGVTSPRALGIALAGELLAGSCAMALGGYLAASTEREIRDQRVATERHEIQHEPAEEKAELLEIYQRKGFRGPLLDRVVDHLTADEERWLYALLHDEHGILPGDRISPWRKGLVIGIAFILGGIAPAVPLLLAPGLVGRAFAIIATALVAALLGALKARYTPRSVRASALQFLALVALGTLFGIAISAGITQVFPPPA
ncbi:MAG: VIT1/CCC1 transporter family protein [Chloroflexi bacterium]|nr:VIT1/CCC1 transporter family protein [Chloroflexota bacterium]